MFCDTLWLSGTLTAPFSFIQTRDWHRLKEYANSDGVVSVFLLGCLRKDSVTVRFVIIIIIIIFIIIIIIIITIIIIIITITAVAAASATATTPTTTTIIIIIIIIII